MATAEFEVQAEVECNECHQGLDVEIGLTAGYPRRPRIRVCPCESCLEKAEDKGYEKGLSDGGDEA